jgi:ferrous iron transport protein B
VYMPCIATMAAIRKETGSWRWTAFSLLYGLGLAWALALVIYQLGSLLGYG